MKNKKNYIFYALGEIVLVVIGILIALYINNQSEMYKEKQYEIVLLKKLKEENLYNINTLIDREEYHKQAPEIFNNFVNYLSENEINSLSDTLGYYLNQTMSTPIYSFSEGNLNNYIVSQKNNFLEINKEVIYLKNIQNDLFNMSEKCVEIKLEDYYKILKKELNFFTGELYSTEVINSLEFRNNMFLLQTVEEEVSRIFGLTLSQMRKVDSLVGATIEKH